MKNLRWFWLINYTITIYSFLLFYSVWNYEGSLYNVLSINDKFPFILSILIEWLQIPIVLVILIWKKQERSLIHWLYWIILLILSISKIILYFFSTGAVTYKS
ncbi:hypothetical protein EG340_11660 [Chryseobacterium indoltheticum]|uniref:Uncharacterized protein n=1 Tax=Chryseobacterium indoltheticum TaxID=254 RepID=A0A381FKJ3_9FLAO|nr:hypothetical protein EG340_11660 [Chryseobacterium indoltheticum]SUX47059.1 Uncharacterised protein [Chryseobacterium indoltheticum]